MGGRASAGLQASEFKNLTKAQIGAKVGLLFTADQKKSGFLASVSMAQFILESGYGKSELAQNANNCFGMKKSLSGNTWKGNTWDGSNIYTMTTQEQKAYGSYETITADFRKYGCLEDSIADYLGYLLGAKNEAGLRYDGLKGCTDYMKATEIIKAGSYATSLTYVEKLCSIIEKWKLTQFDMKEMGASGGTVLASAKTMMNADCLFMVKVSVPDLNIRKGAGTNTDKTGKYTGAGVFTIVEVNAGMSSATGWGKLKSGDG